MKIKELERWLEDSQLLVDADITSTRMAEIEPLLRSDGLRFIWGLMLGTRQALYVQLAQAPLGDPVQVARAAVIQGKIQGIDLFRQTLLELGTPADAGNEGAR